MHSMTAASNKTLPFFIISPPFRFCFLSYILFQKKSQQKRRYKDQGGIVGQEIHLKDAGRDLAGNAWGRGNR